MAFQVRTSVGVWLPHWSMPVGAQHLKALVVAIRSTSRGVDLAQAALLRADGDGRAVHVARGSDGGVGQHRAGGAEPGGFVAIGAENPAEHVEVMNQHVAEDAARYLDVFGRWCTGVAAGDDQHFGVADLAFVHAHAGFVERGVKTAGNQSIMQATPAAFTAAAQASARGTDKSNRLLSQKICLPALAARVMRSLCVSVDDAMATTSTVGSANTASMLETCAPCCCASSAAALAIGSHTYLRLTPESAARLPAYGHGQCGQRQSTTFFMFSPLSSV